MSSHHFSMRAFWIIGLLIFVIFSPSLSANELQAELLKFADKKANGEYVRKRFLQAMVKPVNPNATQTALIIGDSHAQDFFNAVLENEYLNDYKITTHYISSRCQMYMDAELAEHILPKDKAYCETSKTLTQLLPHIAKADVIILSANWKQWAANALPDTIEALSLTPEQKLFVIGRKNFGRINVRKYLRQSEDELRALKNTVDQHQHPINHIMQRSLSKDVLVDQHSLICGSATQCPVFTDELKLISFDGGHLTKDGALYVGKVLFERSALRELVKMDNDPIAAKESQ